MVLYNHKPPFSGRAFFGKKTCPSIKRKEHATPFAHLTVVSAHHTFTERAVLRTRHRWPMAKRATEEDRERISR